MRTAFEYIYTFMAIYGHWAYFQVSLSTPKAGSQPVRSRLLDFGKAWFNSTLSKSNTTGGNKAIRFW